MSVAITICIILGVVSVVYIIGAIVQIRLTRDKIIRELKADMWSMDEQLMYTRRDCTAHAVLLQREQQRTASLLSELAKARALIPDETPQSKDNQGDRKVSFDL